MPGLFLEQTSFWFVADSNQFHQGNDDSTAVSVIDVLFDGVLKLLDNVQEEHHKVTLVHSKMVPNNLMAFG